MKIEFARPDKHQKPNQILANQARREFGKQIYADAVKRSQLKRRFQGKKNWAANSIFG